MALDKNLYTPIAILVGSIIVGAGLFFGLRERPAGPAPAEPSRAAPMEPTLRATSVEPPATAPPVVPPPPGAAAAAPDRKAATEAVKKDLERHRALAVERCVKPALAKTPGMSSLKFFINATFDPEGKQVVRGIIEDREAAIPGVAPCLADAVPALQIPPQGAGVPVEIVWTLP